MKVKELIDALSRCEPNQNVVIYIGRVEDIPELVPLALVYASDTINPDCDIILDWAPE